MGCAKRPTAQDRDPAVPSGVGRKAPIGEMQVLSPSGQVLGIAYLLQEDQIRMLWKYNRQGIVIRHEPSGNVIGDHSDRQLSCSGVLRSHAYPEQTPDETYHPAAQLQEVFPQRDWTASRSTMPTVFLGSAGVNSTHLGRL